MEAEAVTFGLFLCSYFQIDSKLLFSSFCLCSVVLLSMWSVKTKQFIFQDRCVAYKIIDVHVFFIYR